MPGTWSSNIPILGEKRGNEEIDVGNALTKLFEAVNAPLNSSNELNGEKIAKETIPQNKLKSDSTKFWLPVYRDHGCFNFELGPSTAGKYIMDNGTCYSDGSESNTRAFAFFRMENEDYTLVEKNYKFRIRAICTTNGTGSGITYTFGLYSVTASGGSNKLKVSLSSEPAGNKTVAIVSPASLSTKTAVSEEFEPSGAAYLFGCSLSGTMASGSHVNVTAELQMKHVNS